MASASGRPRTGNNTEVQSLMGVGDSDGDGTVELLASTAEGVRLFQAADGAVLLEFDDGVRAHTDVVSGDVDGDGRDEFLFGSGTKLICVEQEEGTLRRAWTLEVEGRSSDIALADVDRDGFLDIVVTTTDGYVKAYMGEAAATAVQAVESTPQKNTSTAALSQPIQQPSAYRFQRRAGRKGAARGFRPDWTAGKNAGSGVAETRDLPGALGCGGAR